MIIQNEETAFPCTVFGWCSNESSQVLSKIVRPMLVSRVKRLQIKLDTIRIRMQQVSPSPFLMISSL